VAQAGSFEHFIGGLHDLHGELRRRLPIPGERPRIAAIARRALAQLRGYRPADEYEAIFVEVAISEFEELLAGTGEVS
jgi:hypothetical protein